jgi:hypothetical protein
VWLHVPVMSTQENASHESDESCGGLQAHEDVGGDLQSHRVVLKTVLTSTDSLKDAFPEGDEGECYPADQNSILSLMC